MIKAMAGGAKQKKWRKPQNPFVCKDYEGAFPWANYDDAMSAFEGVYWVNGDDGEKVQGPGFTSANQLWGFQMGDNTMGEWIDQDTSEWFVEKDWNKETWFLGLDRNYDGIVDIFEFKNVPCWINADYR